MNKTNVKLNKLFYYLKNASLMKTKAFKKNRVRQCCREFEELQFKKKKRFVALILKELLAFLRITHFFNKKNGFLRLNTPVLKLLRSNMA
jgi:hypothetical protein